MGQAFVGSVKSIKPDVKWRDVIQLEISDPDLKKKTEAFLDKLEKSEFSYTTNKPNKGDIDSVSGQALLQSLKERKKFLLGDPGTASVVESVAAQVGIGKANDGKLVIADHNSPFKGTEATGSMTAFINYRGQNVPVGIRIGQDYLKGAKYLGQDMKYHPVQVEGVLANELAHAGNVSPDNPMSDRIENAVLVGLGGVPRVVGKEDVQFKTNQNNGYQSLLTPKGGIKTSAIDVNMVTALALARDQGITSLQTDSNETSTLASAGAVKQNSSQRRFT